MLFFLVTLIMILNRSPLSVFSRSKYVCNYLALSVMLKRSVDTWPTVLVPLAAILLKVVASDTLEMSSLYLRNCRVQIDTCTFQYYHPCHLMLECGNCYKEKGKLSVVIFLTFTYEYKLIF